MKKNKKHIIFKQKNKINIMNNLIAAKILKAKKKKAKKKVSKNLILVIVAINIHNVALTVN